MDLTKEQKEVMWMALRSEARECYDELRNEQVNLKFVDRIEKIMRAFNCDDKVEWKP
jgi:hypothetical protein